VRRGRSKLVGAVSDVLHWGEDTIRKKRALTTFRANEKERGGGGAKRGSSQHMGRLQGEKKKGRSFFPVLAGSPGTAAG